MATSRYSYLRQYAPYVSPYNVDVIKDVMAYKQGRVDANRARMYEQIDYLMGQELAKPQDREYLRTRMSDTIARINEQFDGVDLSSDGVTRAIQGEISSVLDDKVINAIAGTREYQRLMQEIEDIRINHKDQYSPINEQAAIMPYLNWYNDGQVGTRLGSLRYTPYYDYRGEANKRLKDFKTTNKGRKIQEPICDVNGNQTGAMYEINIDDMSMSQVRNMAASSADPRAMEQMRIEAEYMARMNPMYQDPTSFATYAQQYGQRYNIEIAQLEAKIKTVGDNSTLKTMYQSQLNEAKAYRDRYNLNVQEILQNYSPQAAAALVVNNGFLDSMADAWSYDNTSVLRQKDEYWFAKQKENRDSMEFVENMAKKKLENESLRIKNEQEQIALNEMRKNPMLAFRTRGRSGSNGNGGGSDDPFMNAMPAITDQGATTQNRDLFTELRDSINSSEVEYKTASQLLYNSLGDDAVGQIIAAAGDRYQGYNEYDTVLQYLVDNDGEKSAYLNGNNAALSAYLRAVDAMQNRRFNLEAVNRVKEEQNGVLLSIASNARINGAILDAISHAPNNLRTILRGIDERRNYDNASDLYNDRRKQQAFNLAAVASLGLSRTRVVQASDVGGARRRIRIDDGVEMGDVNIIALVDQIRELYGEDFTVSDYISDDGTLISREGIPDGEIPDTMRAIYFFFDNPNIRGHIKGAIGNEVRDAMNQVNENQNRILADTAFSRAYSKFAWGSGDTGDLKAQFEKVRDIYNSKMSSLGTPLTVDQNKAIFLLELVTSSIDGSPKRYLMANGDPRSMVEVTPRELQQNGIPSYVTEGKINIKGYNSGPKDIVFADPETSWGKMYNERVSAPVSVGGYGIQGISFKQDVKNSLNAALTNAQQSNNVFTSEGVEYMRNAINTLVEGADLLSVNLKGAENGPLTNLVIEFLDKDNKYAKEPNPIASQILRVDTGFADDYEFQFKHYAQIYYINYINELIQNRIQYAIQQKEAHGGVPVRGNMEGTDQFNTLLNFIIQKRNAGRSSN